MKVSSVLEARMLKSETDEKIKEFLRKRGWKYTSDTLGCFWMFQKEIDSKRYLVNLDTALSIEEVLENES